VLIQQVLPQLEELLIDFKINKHHKTKNNEYHAQNVP